jgi:ATP-dependent DNA ligase
MASLWCSTTLGVRCSRNRPTYVAFDLLMTEGIDLRPLPLKQRKAMLARVGEGADGWIASLTASSAKGGRSPID